MRTKLTVVSALLACVIGMPALAQVLEFDGWHPYAPRQEVSPAFTVNPEGGPDGRGSLVIEQCSAVGQNGAWTKTFEIEGGAHYQITAHARLREVKNPRAHAYVELTFLNAKGGLPVDETIGLNTRPYYAPDVGSENGWTRFTGIYYAPKDAVRAEVKLQLRWEPGSRIEWGGVLLEKSGPRPPRIVRLAAANIRPTGGASTLDNLRQVEPAIAEAATQHADLVVLGECITSVDTPLTDLEAAEPVPGPATEFLGSLAKKHGLYIVTSLFERVDHLIYNTAVLVGPDGSLVGTYRKVCLARGEYQRGIQPGDAFPVYDTSIGKIGMMICFDVHMPEVARALAANGAEIIAMPIMGGHPDLARARAIENQVYLVSTTYGINDDWMQSGVWDLSGKLIARAMEKNSVVVAEVDLSKQHIWRENMGDFKSRLRHERPAVALPK